MAVVKTFPLKRKFIFRPHVNPLESQFPGVESGCAEYMTEKICIPHVFAWWPNGSTVERSANFGFDDEATSMCFFRIVTPLVREWDGAADHGFETALAMCLVVGRQPLDTQSRGTPPPFGCNLPGMCDLQIFQTPKFLRIKWLRINYFISIACRLSWGSVAMQPDRISRIARLQFSFCRISAKLSAKAISDLYENFRGGSSVAWRCPFVTPSSMAERVYFTRTPESQSTDA